MNSKMIRKAQQGFTLIELMIVVAIIGILAAIALPAYQDYMVRAKWADSVSSVDSIKLAITECLNDQAGVASSCDNTTKLANYGMPATLTNPKYGTVAITETTAAIVTTGTAEVKSCVLTMTPTVSGQLVQWAFTTGTGCGKYIKGATES